VIAERLNFPAFFLGHLNLVKTKAEIDAAPVQKEGGFPVLLFSHGLRGIRGQNTALFEELASQGFVVASADHTYDAIITILPENRAVTHHSNSVFPEGISFQKAAGQLVSVRAEDLLTVASFFENAAKDTQNILHGKLDLQHIGVMGHSTGGATAIEFCNSYTICQAVLVLDGWLEPVSDLAISQSLERPLMFISTQEWLGEKNRSIGKSFINRQNMTVYQLEVVGTEHYNYTDIPLLTPISPQIGLSGSIDPALSVEIVSRLSLAFFKQYLTDIDSDRSAINDLIDNYPEVVNKNT
jgi:dienelactone hydrolase